jgi:hypothetical protein
LLGTATYPTKPAPFKNPNGRQATWFGFLQIAQNFEYYLLYEQKSQFTWLLRWNSFNRKLKLTIILGEYMKNRNPLAVFLLPFVTFGIYSIYWFVKTKGEMNEKGATIPTAWLIIIPIVNIYWLWKWSEGVDHVTNGKMSGVLAFILVWLLGSIGSAIVQDSFNKIGEATAPAAETPSTPAEPTSSVPPAPTV